MHKQEHHAHYFSSHSLFIARLPQIWRVRCRSIVFYIHPYRWQCYDAAWLSGNTCQDTQKATWWKLQRWSYHWPDGCQKSEWILYLKPSLVYVPSWQSNATPCNIQKSAVVRGSIFKLTLSTKLEDAPVVVSTPVLIWVLYRGHWYSSTGGL